MVWSLERLEASLERQLSWIRATESRIALIVPLSTALFGAIAIKFKELQVSPCWLQMLFWLTVIMLVAALVSASIAIFPRTRGPKHSLIFFGGIIQKTVREFHEALSESCENQYREDLIEQIYINANIAAIKYSWIRRAMALLLFSSVPWGVVVALLY